MNKDFFENQINERRKGDEEMFRGAFSDLLSIIGIKTPKSAHHVRGAVADILRYLGKEVPSVPDSVTTLDAQLDYMLKPSHTMRRRVELVGKWWKDCTGCFLGSTVSGEVVAILPCKWSGYSYTDSNGEEIKINEKTAKNLNSEAFCFYKAFPLTSLKIIDLIKFMISGMSHADVFFIVVMALIVQLLGMVMPKIQNVIYNDIIPSGNASMIWPLATFLFGITIGNVIMDISRSAVVNRFNAKVSLMVNNAVMIRFFSLPPRFFKKYTAGELASRMGYIASLCNMIITTVFSTGLTTVFSLGYFFSMNKYAPALVAPGMIALTVNIVYTILITFYQQSIYKKKLDIAPKLQSLTYALFGGMQKIKVTGSERRAFAKWAHNYSQVEKLDYSPPFLIKINGIISLVISTLGTMAIYYFAVSRGVSLSNYISFNVSYGAVSGAIMSLSAVALRFANLGPILDMIKPVMQEKPESSLGRKIPISLSGNIEVNNLTFKYTPDGPTILNDINLKIKKGEYIAIVGKTGCGKSTLMRLLLGFEIPERGAIYYDGKDLGNIDLQSLRQKIGVVMQNGSLFPGDIFSNIIITAPWKTMDDAWQAAEMAGIKEDINAMPMGMNTLISEGTGGISGGQKQRLMMARAIINKPSIIFLDEATSALDNVTQHHVTQSISNLNCTRIVIAHRLSTIKNCDRIIVMDKGGIVEEGCYDDLMDRKGMFYDLAIRQIVE